MKYQSNRSYYRITIIIYLASFVFAFITACGSIGKGIVKTPTPFPLSSSERQNTIFAIQRTNAPTSSPTKPILRKPSSSPSSIPTSELWNSDAWENHGPFGGIVSALAVDPIHPNIIFAGSGTENGGIWKSSDNGMNWKRSDRGILSQSVPQYMNITALVIDPNTPSTLYAGIDWGGVFKSVDGGDHWKQINTDRIKSMAIDPHNSGTVYIGTLNSMYKTINGGETWENILQPEFPTKGNISSITIDPAFSSIIYAGSTSIEGGGKSGVFKSLDGGKTWSFSDTGLENMDVEAIVIDPIQSTILYAATIQVCGCGEGVSEYGGGVFKSLDGGSSWKRILNGRFQSLAIDPKVPSTLFVGANYGLFISKNGGEKWNKLRIDEVPLSVHSIYINPISPSNMIIGTSGGIFKSNNFGTTWSESNLGLHGSKVLALAEDPKEPGVIIASVEDRGLYESADNGEGWNPLSKRTVLPGFEHTLAVDWSNPDVIYASSNGYGVYKSVDRGASWEDLKSSFLLSRIEYGENVYHQPYFITIDPDDPAIIYLGSMYGLFISKNGGYDWRGFGYNDNVNAMAIDPRPPHAIYIGKRQGLFKKANESSQWEKVNLHSESEYITNVFLDPQESNVIYVSDWDSILKSEDGGNNWMYVYNGPHILSMTIDPLKSNTLYVATEDGLLYSNNGGKDWVDMALPEKYVNTIIISRTYPPVLYAGTISGVYSLQLP
jgi:photosystem II stability/assembly factor-like uncharacterized protein